MTYYVPGTGETDLKKIIMSLQQAAGVANATSALSPALAANTMLVDNTAGTARQTRTFAQVLGLLADITGDGTDQTAALQAIVDALPVTGGQILIKGVVNITALDLHGRRNIRLVGIGGAGGGAGNQPSALIVTAGAIGVGVAAINCKDTNDVSFSRLQISATNAAMNGVLIEYGGGTGAPLPANSAYMSIDDCALSTANASSVCLSLYGATDGQFNKVNFNGPGRAILLQTVTTVGFCNGNVFNTCTFTPSGTIFPVLGSGEGLSFIGCVFEPGSDGIGRGWQSSLAQRFKGVSFIGCWFGDGTVAGGQWLNPVWGEGLTVMGCVMGGVAGSFGIDMGGIANADPQIGGVRGVNISGNSFDGFGAAIAFNGTIVAKSNVRGAIIGGNSVTTGGFLSGYATAEQLIFLPNSLYSLPLAVGAHMAFMGLPSYANAAAAVAAGLTTGQMYSITGTGALMIV